MNRYKKLKNIISYLNSSSDSIHFTGWIGYDNLGDELMLQATRAMFHPDQVVCPDNIAKPWIQKLINTKKHQLAILGGGTQIGEPSPIDRFRDALSRSRKGIVLGTGVTPSLVGPIPEWLTTWGDLLRPLAYVGVRSVESAATLRRVGVDADVLGDPVCFFSKPIDFWQPQEKRIGVNVGHSNGHIYGSEERFHSVMVETVAGLLQDGFAVEFFCVWRDDLAVTRSIATRCGIQHPTIHEIYSRAEEFQERVKFMNAFIGIKLHAVALATCTNVPSIMIEYRPKCLEYMNSINVGHYCLRSDDVDPNNLREMLNSVLFEQNSISKELCLHTNAIRKKLLLKVQHLKDHYC